MKRLLILLGVWFLSIPSLAHAFGEYISVQICNEGNTRLYVTNAEVISGGGLLVPATFALSGWHHIEAGDCKYVGDDQPEPRLLGFAIRNAAGEFGMIHETFEFSPGVRETDRALCVDPADAFYREGTIEALQQCPKGFVPARFSIHVFPKFRTTLTLSITADASYRVEPLSIEHYQAKQKAELEAWQKRQQEIELKMRQQQAELEKRQQQAELEKRQQQAELEKLRARAKNGDADAQWDLGGKYYFGRDGISRDYKEAMTFYRLAAEQGNASAQYNVGVMYDNGEGVPQSYDEAMKWYHLAAEQGSSEAQKILADPMHEYDAYRWMAECVKEWHQMYGLTKQEHFKWCGCKIKALLSVKTQLSQATKDDLATYFDGAMKKVPSEVIDKAYKCYHK